MNVNALVRAIACLALAVLLFKITALNAHLQLTPLGMVMLAAFEGLLVAAAARVFLKDAKPPSPNVLHLETRKLNIAQELVISGGGVMLGVFGLYILMGAGANEVWAGHVETRGPKPFEYVLGLFFCATAFPLLFFRPAFTLDLQRRAIRRFPFGRALPLKVGPERSGDDVNVVSEGYFITNTGVRLGDMIRGKLGKNSFELELVRGENTPERLEARIAHWRRTLGAPART